jgi:hypothetical protein
VLGGFLSEDPLRFGAGVNFYVYCGNNPVNCNDPTGQDGEMVIFPGYVINYNGYAVPAVHAGVVSIDDTTGAANYYQFGLYGGQYGNVQGPYNVGTVQFDNQNNPTATSLAAVNQTVATNYGQGITPTTIYNNAADANAIGQYAANQNANLATQPYTINPLSSNSFNTCITFAWNALQAGVNAAANSQNSANSQGNSGSSDPSSGLNNASSSTMPIYPNSSNTSQIQSVYEKP